MVKTKTFSADWDRHGKAAGVIRNQVMLDKGQPDLVVALAPGGRKAGVARQTWCDVRPEGGSASPEVCNA